MSGVDLVIDQATITTMAISLSLVVVGSIGALLFYGGKILIGVFNRTISDLKEDIDACQKRLHEDINKIDEYGKLNRALSYEAKDGIAKHVEKFHSK